MWNYFFRRERRMMNSEEHSIALKCSFSMCSWNYLMKSLFITSWLQWYTSKNLLITQFESGQLITRNHWLGHFFLYWLTCMFGFCALMSALDRSGKFLKSKMNGLVSSSGSGLGRIPTDLCWCWDHLLWWVWGSGRRLWTWFCCSRVSGTYWTPPPWIRWPWT